MTIIIPYRPSAGCMSSAGGTLTQDSNGDWYSDGVIVEARKQRKIVERALYALKKNSKYRHKVIIAIDYDVTPHKDWLKEFRDVEIFKNKYIPKSNIPYEMPYERTTAAVRDVAMSLPDDEWICHTYIADIVCSKNWDKYIFEAINKFGDDKTYSANWVELRDVDPPATWNKIWDVWRRTVTYHGLIIPNLGRIPGEGLITEQEFDDWIKIALEKDPGNNWIVTEACGSRMWGYFSALCLKNKRFKPVVSSIPVGPDQTLAVEDCLGLKVCSLRSFFLHIHMNFQFDNFEVEHEIIENDGKIDGTTDVQCDGTCERIGEGK